MFSRTVVFLWIVCLAALSVGSRNFEDGLSLDAPLYATIARNIARSGEWFRLDCQVPDFVPFAEHPHLGFWAMAVWLKFFPAADWAIRIPGHLMYLLFLSLLFFYIRPRSGDRVAVWTVVLLWSMHLFSNVFSTFYLDPGVLLFGTLALWGFERAMHRRIAWALTAGVFLGLAALYKGLTILGFLPVFGWLALFFWWRHRQWTRIVSSALLLMAGATAVAIAYFSLLKASSVPEFLDLYFARQVTQRFARRWSVHSLLSIEYWRQLLNYSNYLLPFALLTCGQLKRKPFLVFAWVYAGSFIFMFSTSGLEGGQYLIMILPWISWLVAEAVFARVPLAPIRVMKLTAGLSVLLMFVVQYVPIATHGKVGEQDYVGRRCPTAGKTQATMTVALPPFSSPFVLAARYAWYGDVRVQYATSLAATPKPTPANCFFVANQDVALEMHLAALGWHRDPAVTEGSLWIP